MGEKYQKAIAEKITELGAANLRVFINSEGVNPHYRQHLEDTFHTAGVRFVSTRAEANLIFEGDQTPAFVPGKIVAFFQESQLVFAGTW